jgi:DNA repair protein RadC
VFHNIPTVVLREVVAQYRRPIEALKIVSGQEEAARYLKLIVDSNPREHFIVLHLDIRNQVVSYTVTAIGTLDACLVHPREVFQSAILAGASSIIIGHNHPSGILDPSREDIAVTKRLKEAGEILGIRVVDSLIVGVEGYTSLMY